MGEQWRCWRCRKFFYTDEDFFEHKQLAHGDPPPAPIEQEEQA